MSIFISLATLMDLEIHHTISSALDNADNPDSVHIGVCCLTDKTFFEDLLSANKDRKTVIIDWYEPLENLGIGKGRKLSKRRYNGQDNILQVDSHTLFRKGWDTALKHLWDRALEETKNEKTVLTAYLPKYKIDNGSRFVDSGESRYTPLISNNMSMPRALISWGDLPISQFPNPVNDLLLPSNKMNGNFIFSNEKFVENSGLIESALFFEEEIIQAINLIDNGFSLVFPNTTLPLHHLYYTDQDQSLDSRQAPPFSFEAIGSSIQNFIDDPNNYSKCKIWEDYVHADLRKGSVEPWYIPEYFINAGV